METSGLIIFGALVGLVGTLVGIGGGIFVTPLLLLVYGLPPQVVIGTSLFVIFANTLSGSIAYAVRRRINYALGWRIALLTLPGAVLGSFLSDVFGHNGFRITFGGILICFASYLFINTRRRPSDPPAEPAPEIIPLNAIPFKRLLTVYLLSLLIGIISSFLGIGGGIIHIPLLIYVLGLPVHHATATSHFILAITAFTGVVTHFWLSHLDFYYALTIGGGTFLGAQIGALLSHRVHARGILILFAVILILTALRLLLINIP